MSMRPTPGEPAAPATFRGLTLLPFQQKALASIFSGHNVLVAAPTGAGKTLVAEFAIEQALGQGRRVVYTSPIKALSNQKFRDFREGYGEDAVGLMTGDLTMQPHAALLIMTTEIFRNTIFESPERLDGFDFVIFDEVHYLDDRERGTVWEEAIIYAPNHMRIVALSATVPNVTELAQWIEQARELPVDVIIEEERPVPLTHKIWLKGQGPRRVSEVREYMLTQPVWMPRARDRRSRHPRGRRLTRRQQEMNLRAAGHELVDFIEKRELLPAIYFCFSRRDCEELAQAHSRRDLLGQRERERMLSTFDDLALRYDVVEKESTRALRALASRGVLHHHAGMLPIDKEIVERLFTSGLVKLLFATETFAIGVNMPARSVCFHTLAKYDGVSFGPLLVREYWQMAGRAGRQGIDDKGWVFALFDESAVDIRDLERYQAGHTEPVRSRFNLNYSAILNLFRHVGADVPKAWQLSYARFQARRRKQSARRGKARKALPRGARVGGERAIRARMQVLRERAYIDGETLTRKGELCARVNGYEIAVTEAYDGGWLFRCDAVDAAMLFASIVYEARPSDVAPESRRRLKGIRQPFLEHMTAFAGAEMEAGLRDPVRLPDFGIAGLVEQWAGGEDFEALLSRTSLAAGDLVRILRMTIQLLRQAEHALSQGDPVAQVLREARERLDRDVVDARRQLELG